jgi:hypothetical protein
MKTLYTEIVRRFPEIRSKISEGDEELPYLLISFLADWLKEMGGAITPSITERIVAFVHWCESQPSGKDAGDDIFTILVVGFYEKLFEAKSTRALLPRFLTPQDMTANVDYFRQWVGTENYEKALKEYDRSAGKGKRAPRKGRSQRK